jgi:hypothetical protein
LYLADAESGGRSHCTAKLMQWGRRRLLRDETANSTRHRWSSLLGGRLFADPNLRLELAEEALN